MKPLKQAIIPREETERTIEEVMVKWRAGMKAVRDAYPGLTNEDDVRAAVRSTVFDELRGECWCNDIYQVLKRRHKSDRPGQPDLIHLSIKRMDREPCKDWRHFQQIKNQLVGPECEGVELYPAESRLVDSANQYHLWCFDSPTFRFPLGYTIRMVSEENIGKSKQRPMEEKS